MVFSLLTFPAPAACWAAQAKRITHKLHLYRKFTNTLALTAGACVAWIGYEVSREEGCAFPPSPRPRPPDPV